MGVQFISGPDRIHRDDADPKYTPPPLMGFGWREVSRTEGGPAGSGWHTPSEVVYEPDPEIEELRKQVGWSAPEETDQP